MFLFDVNTTPVKFKLICTECVKIQFVYQPLHLFFEVHSDFIFFVNLLSLLILKLLIISYIIFLSIVGSVIDEFGLQLFIDPFFNLNSK